MAFDAVTAIAVGKAIYDALGGDQRVAEAFGRWFNANLGEAPPDLTAAYAKQDAKIEDLIRQARDPSRIGPGE